MEESRRDQACAVAAVLVPALCLAAVAPYGAQPVNDDWQSYWSAFHFARTGEARILDYSAMGMVGLTVPAGFVARWVGEGFVAMRLISMAALLVSAWATYRLCREVGARPVASLAVSTMTSTSPVLFWLSTTFMTDGAWHALWAAALLMFARGCRTGRALDFALGAAAATWAAWIRVPVAAAPLGLAAAAVICRRRPSIVRPALFSAGAALVLGVAGFFVWYRFVHGPTSAYAYKSGVDVAQMIHVTPGGVFACVAYAGLFLLPLAPVVLTRPGAVTRGAVAAAGVFAALALVQAKTGFLGAIHKSMPYVGNVAFNLGLGPMTVTDVYREGGDPPVMAPGAAQMALGVLCAGVGAALIWIAARRVVAAVRSRSDPVVVLLAAATVLYLGSAVVFTKDSAPLFDRYLTPMIVPLAAILATAGTSCPAPSRSVRVVSGALLVVVAAFAVAGARDFHRFTEARFDLAAVATTKTGTPRRVDGGFEFDCWHNYEAASRGDFKPAANWKGWLVEYPQYVVATRERPGYDVADQRPLFSLVGLKRWDLLLLRRR